VYCRPATSSVDRLPKEFGCVILIFSELGRVSALAVVRGATAELTSQLGRLTQI
jgi:hypothetical protein